MVQRFSTEQRIFICCNFIKNESATRCRREFQERFPGVAAPHRRTVRKIVKKFKTTGSVLDKKLKRRRHILTERKLDDIGALLEQSPQKCLSKLAQQAGVSYTSAQRATKLLKFHRYKMTEVQALNPTKPQHVVNKDSARLSEKFPEVWIKSEPVDLDGKNKWMGESREEIQHRDSGTIKVEPNVEITTEECSLSLEQINCHPEKDDLDWGVQQLDTVRDRPWVSNYNFLALTPFGHHGLHHLFPTVDHGHLDALVPIVKKTCAEFGVSYEPSSVVELAKGQFLQCARKEPNLVPPGKVKH